MIVIIIKCFMEIFLVILAIILFNATEIILILASNPEHTRHDP